MPELESNIKELWKFEDRQTAQVARARRLLLIQLMDFVEPHDLMLCRTMVDRFIERNPIEADNEVMDIA